MEWQIISRCGLLCSADAKNGQEEATFKDLMGQVEAAGHQVAIQVMHY